MAGFDLSKFGAAPTKFDADDLFPLTARILAARPYSEVAEAVRAAGVPDALAEQFWSVVRENVTTLNDLEGWWAVFSGKTGGVAAEEDHAFVEEALSMLAIRPIAQRRGASGPARSSRPRVARGDSCSCRCAGR